jgi:hypothetical protein
MSLISDQQRKNAQAKTPEIKPVKVAQVAQDESLLPSMQPEAPQLEPATAPPQADVGSFVEPEQPQPENTEEKVDFSLFPEAPVEVQQKPTPAILPTAPIWKDLEPELGAGASLRPEVSSTMLPSFSVQIPDNSNTLNRAFNSVGSAYGRFNQQQQEQYSAAQQATAQVKKPGALPNTPDATKPWYAAPLGFMSDVLFGSEKAKKESEAGAFNPLLGSYGRAGAGVGGFINYALDFVPNYIVGVDVELTKFRANALQTIGVKKETAEAFARDNFLMFLPNYIGGGSGYEGVGTGKLSQGGLNVGALKPSKIFNLDFDEANKRNLLLEAFAGNPLNDINEPTGSVKYGRIYTRSQRKEGSSATSDPVGFALQIGTYLFNPGDIPGDRLISYGVGKLFNVFKKPAAATVREAAKINVPALPPGRSLTREQQLTQEANAARTATAARQFFNQPQARVGLDLSAINEQQLNRLQNGTPRLEGTTQPDLLSLPSTGDMTTTAPGVLNPTENLGELNPPRLDGGEARLEGGAIEFVNPSELNPPRLDFGEATLEYPTNANLPFAANPTKVPRAYLGSSEVSRQALPPAFDPSEVPEVAPSLLPYNTPAKLALEIGVGNANYRIEKAGALAVRPLQQVIETLKQAEPKLLEGFEGLTWEDFKAHVSVRMGDIGQVSGVGEDLTNVASELKTTQVAESLAEKFLLARTAKGDAQIDASFAFSIAQKELLQGRSDELNSFMLRQIYDTPEAKQVIRDKLDSLLLNKEVLDEATKAAIGSFKSDEVAKEKFTLFMRDNLKGKKDEYNRFRTGEFWSDPKIQQLVRNKFSELLTTPKKSVNLVDEFKTKTYVITEDDLLTAAEELAQHKLALENPLQQLDEIFDTTVDFGRKSIDTPPVDIVGRSEALKAISSGGILNILSDGSGVAEALRSADYDTLDKLAKEAGVSVEDLVNQSLEASNKLIAESSRVSANVPPLETLAKVEGSLFHGTALDSWQPPASLYVNGSRGELGSGTYYTLDKTTAADYAQARVGENVSAKTFEADINPTVAEVTQMFETTLDARATLDKKVLREVFKDLPSAVYQKFNSALNRKKKPLSFVQMRSLMEESFVKAGVEPTEELLQAVDADISKNLRQMGYDSVLDNESGFVLSLDNSFVNVRYLENVPAVNAIEAAKARYNADAFAAKHYKDMLTTDANLRDSAYKILSQVRASVDKKLSQVQDDLISKGISQRPSLLPDVSVPTGKPKSFIEAVDELNIEDICGI